MLEAVFCRQCDASLSVTAKPFADQRRTTSTHDFDHLQLQLSSTRIMAPRSYSKTYKVPRRREQLSLIVLILC